MIVIDALALLAGIAGGLGAVLFRKAIGFFELVFRDRFSVAVASVSGSEALALALMPVLGGLIIGPIVARVAPETRGHGVPEVMEAVLVRGGRIRARVAAVKVLVSSITIGSGGSAGREGPIAQIGASLGSLLGRLAKLDAHDTRLLVACGLSAGIAGTFNAPLGGALFGMEVLLRSVGPFDAIPIILASVVGASTASIFLGQKPSFAIPHVPEWTPAEIPVYILHGVIIGFIAVAWVKLFYSVEELFSKLPVPLHIKPALGGLVAGVLLALLPAYGIGGVGYEGVEMALLGVLPVALLVLLASAKMVATAFTIGSGGSGGVFAPSLYIGSMVGGALGAAYAYIAPGLVGDTLGYTLAGMAALFAGAAQAPLNVIVMIPEMSGSYSLIPPIMASASSSFLVAWMLLRGSSIYTIKLERRGLQVRMFSSFILDSVKVGEVMTKSVVTVPDDTPLSFLEVMFEENPYGGYPVIDRRTGDLVGIVTRTDLERARKRLPRDRLDGARVIDIATRDLVVAYPDETVREALAKMKRRGVSRLPVVDRGNERKLVGIITVRDLVKAYELAFEREEARETRESGSASD